VAHRRADVDVDGVTVEVWYPARPDSDRGQPRARYDLRAAMPAAEAAKIARERFSGDVHCNWRRHRQPSNRNVAVRWAHVRTEGQRARS
jgi:hypothetical protein